MFFLEAVYLIKNNVDLNRVITNTNETLSWGDMYWYKLEDMREMVSCDVYIKINKTDCPKAIRDNISLDIKEFKSKQKQCRMNYVIYTNKQNWFPSNSEIVENTPQYFMLKFPLKNVSKNKLNDKCEEMLYKLALSCTECREKEWKNRNEAQWQKLHDRRAKLLNRVKGNEQNH